MVGDKTIVFTGGTWDLFHVGHLNLLKQAKKYGDFLIVGVSTNKLISSYKGRSPILNYYQRSQIIKELRCVDMVVKQHELFDVDQFLSLGARYFVIGDDWLGKEHLVPGLKWLQEHDCLKYVPYTKGLSSTLIKESIIKKSASIQNNVNSRL